MSPVWKDIPGYEGLYQASDAGQVRSLLRQQKADEKVLTPTKNGYLHVQLYKDGKARSWLVHRLIALAFLGAAPLDGASYVRHLDGDRTNNCLSNLAYGTAKQNMEDQLSYIRPGENLRGWKLTESDVRAIRKRIENGEPNLHICKDYGVSDVVISNIKLGRSYQWVT